MTITERVAYLKGLMEGLEIDTTKKEGKILAVMAEILDDLALSVTDIDDTISDLEEQVEAIDEDLGTLEEDFYEDEDEDDCCCCDDDDDLFEDDIYEVECPKCGDVVCIDSDMLEEGKMTCANCGEVLEFDLDDDCCCCDDHCDCDHE
ncbi:MAG: hypothetical protein RR048_05775 [Oscillospiraceae bacterium]